MIEQWQKGEPITANRLNRMVVQSNDTASMAGRFPRVPVPNAVPFPVTVVSVEDDYLICRPMNMPNGNADIYVAKPWELRKTPFDGLTLPNVDGTLMSYAYTGTQARTVTDTSDSSTEDQVIVPAYVPAQTISETGYTGTEITVQRVAFGPTASFTGSGNFEVQIEYEDMNRAGRAWAEDNGS